MHKGNEIIRVTDPHLQKLFYITLILLTLLVFQNTSTLAAESSGYIIPAENAEKAQALCTPSNMWQQQHGKLLQIAIKKHHISLQFAHAKDGQRATFEVLPTPKPMQQHSACLPLDAEKTISVCFSKNDQHNESLARAWLSWQQENEQANAFSSIWHKQQARILESKPEFQQPVDPARFPIMSALVKYVAEPIAKQIPALRLLTLSLATIALILVFLSIRSLLRSHELSLSRSSRWIALLLFLVLIASKWLLLPHANLILYDEYENMGCIRELNMSGQFAFRLFDVNGFDPVLANIDYAPLFHMAASVLNLLGFSIATASAVINVLVTSLFFPTILILVRIATPNSDERIAIALALLYASLPANVVLSLTAATHPMFQFWMILTFVSAAALIRQPQRTGLHLATLVFCASAAFYGRNEAFFVLAGLAFASLLLWKLSMFQSSNPHFSNQFPTWKNFAKAGLAFILLTLPVMALMLANDLAVEFSMLDKQDFWTRVTIGRGYNFLRNALAFGFIPLTLPVWLSISAILGVILSIWNKSFSRRYGLWIVVCYLWTCFVYTQDDWYGETMQNWIERPYQMGIIYLFVFCMAIPLLSRLKNSNKLVFLFLVAFALNLYGTVDLFEQYYYRSKRVQCIALENIKQDLPDNSVIYAHTSISIRFVADLDHSDLRYLSRLPKINNRPIFYFDMLGRAEEKMQIENYGYHLQKTKHRNLYRLLDSGPTHEQSP